jgi:DNA primase large subunit
LEREELRRQFSRAETALFKYRLETESSADREAFLSGHEFSGKQADEEELRQCKKNLEQLIPPGASSTWLNGPFYKVPWHKVTELVATRRVFLKGGMAFVPQSSRSSIITQEFSAQLDKALELTSRSIARLEEDDRLEPVLAHLGKGFLAGMAGGYEGDEEFSLGEKITAEMIDDLARKHFPSCMRNLHERLRGDKHLKHFGRLQYNLFLKVNRPICDSCCI